MKKSKEVVDLTVSAMYPDVKLDDKFMDAVILATRCTELKGLQRRGSWMERCSVRSVFIFGLCWRCARLPSGISENWMCLTASRTLSMCSRWFGNCILALSR